MTPTETVVVETAQTDADPVAADDQVIAELLVEEISIDGMCGVY